MKEILRKIRQQYRKPGMVEKLYAVVLPAAFLPFVVIFVLLWRYCSGMFSDSIRLSAEESFRSRQNQLQILLDDYLEISGGPAKALSRMTGARLKPQDREI